MIGGRDPGRGVPAGAPRGGGVLRLLAASTVAGVGLSAGQDAYALARRWWKPLVVVAAAAGTLWAAYDLTRGNRRGPLAFLGRSVALNAALVAASACVTGFAASLAGVPDAWVLAQVGLAGTGVLAGLWARPGRLRAFAVAEHNEDWLARTGFASLGGERAALSDPFGNEIEPYDLRDRSWAFTCLDRPGRIARILLDERGRMTAYEGPGPVGWEVERVVPGEVDTTAPGPWGPDAAPDSIARPGLPRIGRSRDR